MVLILVVYTPDACHSIQKHLDFFGQNIQPAVKECVEPAFCICFFMQHAHGVPAGLAA